MSCGIWVFGLEWFARAGGAAREVGWVENLARGAMVR